MANFKWGGRGLAARGFVSDRYPYPFLMRCPRSMGEKRAYEQAVQQGVRPRLARSVPNLVDNWDDVIVTRWRDKSWKNLRLKQWRT